MKEETASDMKFAVFSMKIFELLLWCSIVVLISGGLVINIFNLAEPQFAIYKEECGKYIGATLMNFDEKGYLKFDIPTDVELCKEVEVDEIRDERNTIYVRRDHLTINWLNDFAECTNYCEERWGTTVCPADEEVRESRGYECSEWKINEYTVELQ